MAICKHIPSKNGFGAALEYLTMQHSPSGQLLRDDTGIPLPRERYLINGINCLPETFAPLCLEDRIRFGKSFDAKTVDTHQYIISFAPSDAEKGLTLEKAHQFGFHLALKNFPGHRILVCTHPDGDHQAGNIHVHIIISSLRFEDRPPEPNFMRLKSDGSVQPSAYKAGYSHQDTPVLRKFLLSQVNSYCRSQGYVICPEKASDKITVGEYYARKSGMETRFDQLRHAISDAAVSACTWEEFTHKLASGYTYRVPVIPSIPYTIRQKLWTEYKDLNADFRSWDAAVQISCRNSLDSAFQELKNCKNKNRKEEIRTTISKLKEKQMKERLFRKIYQTYTKAASLALRNRNPEDAQFCLEQMQELLRRCDGYWKDGWIPTSGTFSLITGTIQSHINWTQITESELQLAKNILANIQEIAQTQKPAFSELTEKSMPIEVKLSRGAISFRHPDSEHWVRGKRLGANYTLDALGFKSPKNQIHCHRREPCYQR